MVIYCDKAEKQLILLILLLGANLIIISSIKWHMIGHLQTKKVKQIIPYVSLIHSVDSLKLLNEINKCY